MKKRIKIGIIILAILLILSIGSFICINVFFTNCHNRITLADWLSATCVIFSLAGTLFLSYVTITQNEKANDTNDKLLNLNKDLQKTTELQSKLSNQDNYPMIYAENISFIFNDINPDNDDNSWGLAEKREKIYFSDFYNLVRYSLDCSSNKTFGKCTNITFELINKSKSKICEIKVKKIDSIYPLKFEVETNFVHSTILKENDKFKCNFLLYHESDVGDVDHTKTMLFVKFTMEIKLVTGVVFEEELYVTNANFSEPHSRIDSLTLLNGI